VSSSTFLGLGLLMNRVDLRSIMAETEASSSKPRPPIPTSLSGSIRPTASAFTPPKTGPTSSGAPWRSIEQARPSLSAVQAAQVGSPPPSANSFPGLGRSPATPAQSSQRLPSGSKVFTPTKTPAPVTRKASR